MSRDSRDPYRILHVHPDADPDVIAAAYRVLARKLHPDTAADADPIVAARMAELNWAWALLRDPERRQTYDRDQRFSTSRRQPAAPADTQERSHGVSRPDPGYDPGTVRLDFGRYQGWTLRQILQRDPAYLEWLRRHSSGAPHREAIAQLLREDATRRR
jgi:curved DNA-binding protein CbpA